VGTIYIACRGLVLNNSIGSVNQFPWVHHETIQRGSLAAIVRPRVRCTSTVCFQKVLFYWVVESYLRRAGKLEISFTPHASEKLKLIKLLQSFVF
jgi:hypothetical protein